MCFVWPPSRVNGQRHGVPCENRETDREPAKDAANEMLVKRSEMRGGLGNSQEKTPDSQLPRPVCETELYIHFLGVVRCGSLLDNR